MLKACPHAFQPNLRTVRKDRRSGANAAVIATPRVSCRVSRQNRHLANLSQARLSLFTQSNDAIPAPFLVILILWLAVIFTSFGLFVRPNRAAIVTFFIGGLSVASAIFLILEMGQPFTGLMQFSSEAPRHALEPLGP